MMSLDTTDDQRWREWQIRGRLQDRRTAIHARIFAAVMVSGALGWLVVALLARP